ncbi:hypothetical protein GCM10027570_52230 [Streptomonospora sediminis]
MNDEVNPVSTVKPVSTLPAAETECRSTPGPTAVAGVAAVSVVLVAVTVWARYSANPALGPLLLDIAAGALGCVLAPLLLWRPVPAALGLVVLAAFSPAATPPATLAALQVAQRRPLPLAGAVAAAGVAAHAVQGWWQPSSGLSYGWWLVLITAGYGAMVGWGALARANRALVESLRERARRAEAEQGRRVAEARMAERTRMAREMHDVLAHRLSLLATYAGALEYRPDSPPERLAHAAGVVRTGVHQALDELREVILVLRHEDAAEGNEHGREHGREHAAGGQPRFGDIRRLVEESRSAGTQVRLGDGAAAAIGSTGPDDLAGLIDAADPNPATDRADPSGLPAAVGRTAYRVVQEGLTNARKHAPGRPVDVELAGRPGEALEVSIANPIGHVDHPDGATEEKAGAGVPAAEEVFRTAAAAGAPAAEAIDSAGAGNGAGSGAGNMVGNTTGNGPGKAGAAPRPVPGSGTGLVGLTERVRLAGGRLDHGVSGGRFLLHARLPWPA